MPGVAPSPVGAKKASRPSEHPDCRDLPTSFGVTVPSSWDLRRLGRFVIMARFGPSRSGMRPFPAPAPDMGVVAACKVRVQSLTDNHGNSAPAACRLHRPEAKCPTWLRGRSRFASNAAAAAASSVTTWYSARRRAPASAFDQGRGALQDSRMYLKTHRTQNEARNASAYR